MKKLTESDIMRIVNNVISEQESDRTMNPAQLLVGKTATLFFDEEKKRPERTYKFKQVKKQGNTIVFEEIEIVKSNSNDTGRTRVIMIYKCGADHILLKYDPNNIKKMYNNSLIDFINNFICKTQSRGPIDFPS